jgi:hypothetical protein
VTTATTLFIAVALGSLGMAAYLLWAGRDIFIVGVMGSMAAFAAAVGFWQAVRARRLQHTPLIVASAGCVCYDGRELCLSASVQAVQLKQPVEKGVRPPRNLAKTLRILLASRGLTPFSTGCPAKKSGAKKQANA